LEINKNMMLLKVCKNNYYTTICINCNLDFGAIGNPSGTNLVRNRGNNL